MTFRREALSMVACAAAMVACHFAQLEPVTSLEAAGEKVPLRAAYWVPPEFRHLDGHFYPLMEAAGCGLWRICVDERRIFPTGIGSVARAVFAASHEVSTMEEGFADPNADVVLAPELSGIDMTMPRPLMIRIVWRIWAKDRSIAWLGTITGTAKYDLFSMNRNGRAVAFNQCARDQFQRTVDAMRTGRWWETPALREEGRGER